MLEGEKVGRGSKGRQGEYMVHRGSKGRQREYMVDGE